MTIEVGHMEISQLGEVIEMSGDFQSNKVAVDTLLAIVKDIRLHSVMKLTKDNFKVLTIQYSDHYYKVHFTSESSTVVFKYKMTNNLETSVIA